MKKSLGQRVADALQELGQDPKLAAMLLRSLSRRGVKLEIDATYDHCRCFPRWKAPKKQDSICVCAMCKLRIDSERERKIAVGLGIKEP